jgi:hypothetical protein
MTTATRSPSSLTWLGVVLGGSPASCRRSPARRAAPRGPERRRGCGGADSAHAPARSRPRPAGRAAGPARLCARPGPRPDSAQAGPVRAPAPGRGASRGAQPAVRSRGPRCMAPVAPCLGRGQVVEHPIAGRALRALRPQVHRVVPVAQPQELVRTPARCLQRRAPPAHLEQRDRPFCPRLCRTGDGLGRECRGQAQWQRPAGALPARHQGRQMHEELL